MITDTEMQELRERNAQRLQEAKEKLGEKYLLHPNNHVKKLSRRKRTKSKSAMVVS